MESPGALDSKTDMTCLLVEALTNCTVEEISVVIRLLTQSVPSLQQKALERFFTQDAAFSHPFCRVPNFEGSRWYVLKIFQWYKVMSPRIELEIHSIGQSLFALYSNSKLTCGLSI